MSVRCPVYTEAVRQITAGATIFVHLPIDESTGFTWLCDPEWRGLKLFGSAEEAQKYRSRKIALALRNHPK